MDVTKLRYFCTTAESGAMRRAAQILHVSPGAISKAIKSIEHEFKLKIFTDGNDGSTLTKDGMRLYEYSKKMLLDYEQVRLEFSKAPGENGILRLGSYCIFTSFLLDELLASTFPDVSVLQKRLAPGDLEQGILDQKVDLGITYLPFPQKGLDFLPICKFTMNAFATKGAFPGQSIDQVPFVTSVADVQGSAYSVRNLDGWPYTYIHRNVKYRVSGLDTALGIARRGLAAVFCPSFLISLHNKIVSQRHQLEPLPSAMELRPNFFEIYLVKRAGTPETKVIKKLASRIRVLCKQDPYFGKAASMASLSGA